MAKSVRQGKLAAWRARTQTLPALLDSDSVRSSELPTAPSWRSDCTTTLGLLVARLAGLGGSARRSRGDAHPSRHGRHRRSALAGHAQPSTPLGVRSQASSTRGLRPQDARSRQTSAGRASCAYLAAQDAAGVLIGRLYNHGVVGSYMASNLPRHCDKQPCHTALPFPVARPRCVHGQRVVLGPMSMDSRAVSGSIV